MAPIPELAPVPATSCSRLRPRPSTCQDQVGGKNFRCRPVQAVCLLLALLTTPGRADPQAAAATENQKIVADQFVETEQPAVKLSGYVDTGYTYGFTGSGNQSVVNARPGDPARGDFNLYALKLVLEKALTQENKAQAGFRVDVFIGEDANYLTSHAYADNVDADSNALFFEQAYAQFRVPVGNGWDWKVGKYVSILGYEVIERPANMNISYSLLFNDAFSITYTGVLTSYRFNEILDAKLGVGNGADSDNNLTIDGNGDGATLLAALNLTAPGGNANWSHVFGYETSTANNSSGNPPATLSSYGFVGATNPDGPAYVYNSWGNWAPRFADNKLLLAFDSCVGAYCPANGPAGGATTLWGGSVYAKYQWNEWFYLAGRGTYFGADNQNKTGVTTAGGADGSISWWSYTLTAGFQLIDNLLIRTEYRMDWGANMVGGSGGTVTAPGIPGSGGPAYEASAEVVFSF